MNPLQLFAGFLVSDLVAVELAVFEMLDPFDLSVRPPGREITIRLTVLELLLEPLLALFQEGLRLLLCEDECIDQLLGAASS